MIEKTYSARQVSKLLGVSYNVVLTWIRNGELAAFNAAADASGQARFRVTESAVKALQERRKVAAAEPVQRPKGCPGNSAPGIIHYYK